MAFSPSGAMISPPARPRLSTNLPAAARSIKVVEAQERTTSGPNYYKIKRVIYIRTRACVPPCARSLVCKRGRPIRHYLLLTGTTAPPVAPCVLANWARGPSDVIERIHVMYESLVTDWLVPSTFLHFLTYDTLLLIS